MAPIPLDDRLIQIAAQDSGSYELEVVQQICDGCRSFQFLKVA
jgi:hypothetical protein